MTKSSSWRVAQVLNNNVVLAVSSTQPTPDPTQDAVLFGRGIGFQRKRGDLIATTEIQQIYHSAANQPPEQLARLVAEIDPKQLELAQNLADLAQVICHTSLPDSAVVALADHLRLATERTLAGAKSPAALQWEIQHLYPSEYAFGKQACQLVRAQTGVQFDTSEAVAIALHVVNVQYDRDNQNFARTVALTELLERILDIVDAALPGGPGILDRDSLATARFIAHIRFLLKRLVNPVQETAIPGARLQDAVAHEYPTAYRIAKRVMVAINFEAEIECSNAELTYLTLHIARLMQN
ncbi:MAG: PRD domain-containing protein [Corynebacterium sp.]|nr:PRD domain-containing protein [Corynebacterium sp.]